MRVGVRVRIGVERWAACLSMVPRELHAGFDPPLLPHPPPTPPHTHTHIPRYIGDNYVWQEGAPGNRTYYVIAGSTVCDADKPWYGHRHTPPPRPTTYPHSTTSPTPPISLPLTHKVHTNTTLLSVILSLSLSLFLTQIYTHHTTLSHALTYTYYVIAGSTVCDADKSWYGHRTYLPFPPRHAHHTTPLPVPLPPLQTHSTLSVTPTNPLSFAHKHKYFSLTSHARTHARTHVHLGVANLTVIRTHGHTHTRTHTPTTRTNRYTCTNRCG